tara:strand:- start:129 stop:893 length:765 start_codon:yes stop_codon:yes gene_type:complete
MGAAAASPAMSLGMSAVSGIMSASAGSKAKAGLYEHASLIEEFGEEDATNVEEFGALQVAYQQEQAAYKHDFAIKSSRLEDKKVDLFEQGVKKDIRDEKRAARDRMMMRTKSILDTLSNQTAARAAQGIVAFDGSPLHMQRVDFLEYEADKAIDRGDTAERIVDLKFFGGERAKLMRERNSLMREIAGVELASALSSASLTETAYEMQASSMRRSYALEADSYRIQGRSAQRQGFMSGMNTLFSGINRYQSLTG